MPDPVLNLKAERLIRVAKPWITQEEIDSVAYCVRSGFVSSGPHVADFESEFSSAHSRKHGIACNSGTTAIRLALAALNIGPGQRVALPTMTMIAVANAILDCGATPVFVDSEAGGIGNICVGKAIDACFRESCSAIILPHLYGHPIEYREQDFPCPVIEDCAEIHFGRFAAGDSIGTRSVMACFSFFANKIVQTGEGGMVLCNETQLNSRLRGLRAHAFSEQEHFNHTEHAFGYRMSDMQAAMGSAQHSRRQEILLCREHIAGWYHEYLDGFGIKNLYIPEMPAGGVWWVLPVKIGAESNRSRDDYRRACHAAGIETRTYFRPLHRQRHLLKFAPPDSLGLFHEADKHWRSGFYLPLYPEMTEEDVAYIAGVLRSV